MASKLFLAEDAALQAKIYQRALSKIADVEVTVFEDGLEVYLEVFRNPPDVLILDVNLPTLSGAAALRLIKYDRVTQKIPTLMLSANSEWDIEHQLREMRADGYLAKPFKPEQLTAEVSRLLGRPLDI
jgi:DNA-binding response OmpR family regulator